jgi:hypothetical protein
MIETLKSTIASQITKLTHMMKRSFIILLALSCASTFTHGWVTLSSRQNGRLSDEKRKSSARVGGSLSTLAAVPAIDDASSLLLAQESWRQYIPLAVSALVIVDILLGSPLLNLVVAPMKRQAEGEGGNETSMFQQPKVNPKERIDSEKVAQEAIDKARNSLELREFLDQQKDPIEEARKALDKQMADLDETLDKKKIQQ